MPLEDNFNKFERLNCLIKRKSTGTRTQLSKKLGVSTRTVQVYINTMKFYGAPIKFCRLRESYIYTQEGNFEIVFNFVKDFEFQQNKSAPSINIQDMIHLKAG